jgi:hypothetical protein
MTLTRRRLLSAFASASALAPALLKAGTPKVCKPDPTDRVNVVFHGTFAFDFHGDGVTAICPEVAGHSYGIGVAGEEVYLPAGPCQLGFQGGPPPANPSSGNTPDGAQYLVVNRAIVGDPKMGFCWINLPVPDEFHGLRYASDSQFFTTASAYGSPIPGTLPTITVLRYFRDPRTLTFAPVAVWQRPPGVCNKLNVHVFADPGIPGGGDDNHSSMAMDALDQLFWNPLPFQINPDADTAGFIDDDLNGDVPRWEQLSLGERLSGKASSIRNCLAVGVTDGTP